MQSISDKINKYTCITMVLDNAFDRFKITRIRVHINLNIHQDIKYQTLAEFRSVVKDTKSNTKNFTKSISIHSDYQSVHFW